MRYYNITERKSTNLQPQITIVNRYSRKLLLDKNVQSDLQRLLHHNISMIVQGNGSLVKFISKLANSDVVLAIRGSTRNLAFFLPRGGVFIEVAVPSYMPDGEVSRIDDRSHAGVWKLSETARMTFAAGVHHIYYVPPEAALVRSSIIFALHDVRLATRVIYQLL